MIKAEVHTQEADRLEALRQYKVLDTPSEEAYDDITAMAAGICNTPIALISLIDEDRQWFKSKIGFAPDQTSRDISFCAHAILKQSTMVVSDTLQDERFVDNPLVSCKPGIRFYVGVPLATPTGFPIGTLCVLDYRPRELSECQQKALEALARQIVLQLEMQRVMSQLAEALDKIKIMEGLIPICSYCKGIRNDEGYWSTVERFIEQYSDVGFTHGVCDSCIRRHFPEVAQVLLSETDMDKVIED